MNTRFLSRIFAGIYFRQFAAEARDPKRTYERSWKGLQKIVARHAAKSVPALAKASTKLADYPITDFEDYRPALERSFETGISALNGEKILFWSMSTGTTGKQKLFPMTRRYYLQYRKVILVIFDGLMKRFGNLFRKRAMIFVVPATGEFSPSGAGVGYIGTFSYFSTPTAVSAGYVFPKKLYEDAQAFANWSGLYALTEDLSGVFGTNPASIRRFIENLIAKKESLLPVLTGKAPWPKGLPVRKPSARRLATIQAALAEPQLKLSQLWPSLQFISGWKTSICGAQWASLEPYLDSSIARVDTPYGATESFMNLPGIGGTEAGGPIHPGAAILEFIPIEKSITPENLIPPWELKTGHDYEIFLTTQMGFVRYRIKDVVRCTGFYGKLPVIEFLHKSDHTISLGLSAVSEAQLVEAARLSQIALHDDFRFGPNSSGDALVLYHPHGSGLDEVRLARLEAALCELNYHYQTQRKSGALLTLRTHSMEPSHPLFQVKEFHAQTKNRCIVQTCPV